MLQIDKGVVVPSGKTDVSECRLTAKAMENGDSVFFPGAANSSDSNVKRMVHALLRDGAGTNCRVVEGGVRVWKAQRKTSATA